MTRISEVQIIPIKPNNGLIAFASLVLDNKLYLSSIGVHKKLNGSGYRLTYPTKKVGQKSLNIFHPINSEAGKAIEEAILDKAKAIFEKGNEKNDRYDCFNNS
jgi:stage V sporulation protein G